MIDLHLMTKEGYDYSFDATSCEECGGKCCIGESGFIWINKAEINVLSKYLNISIDEVKDKYLRKVNYKYTIKEVQLDISNFACKFFDLERKQCSIYEARPIQCRTFPFWDYFKNNIKEVYEECPGIKPL